MDGQQRRVNKERTGLSAADARKKREETTISLRKAKREDALQKRRREGLQKATVHAAQAPPGGEAGVAQKLVLLPESCQKIASEDPQAQLEGTSFIRQLLSVERGPPIDEVIASGCVPRLVQFLMREDYERLQFEAAWALTNIASGTSEHTRFVIDAQATPLFVRLLMSPSDDVREQAVWALGNIAGDSPEYRDLVLSHNVMEPLLNMLAQPGLKLSILRNATWTLSNMCRGKPSPNFDVVKVGLPVLGQLLHHNDVEVLTDACWAVSYLSDGTNDEIREVLGAGICRRLVELLMHADYTVQTPALRAVGNIVTGDDEETQVVINCSALPCLLSLLSSPRKGLRKESCWAISNITAGRRDQIQAVIDANLIPPVLQLLANAEFEIRKEASWAITNATSGGSVEQIKYLVSQGCIKPLCDMLMCNDAKIITICLEGLENILKVGEGERDANQGVNPYTQLIDEAEGLDKIEQLQNHPNRNIWAQTNTILERYFGFDDAEDETLAPEVTDSQQFAFGAQPQMPQGGFNFG